MKSNVGTQLRNSVLVIKPELLQYDAHAANQRPAPDKWSPKEILGHLIDSASNNHQRFVRAQMQADLVFAGYEQDRWVHCQAYQQADWLELIELWAAYNLHLARVMDAIPETVRYKEHLAHNLHQIAWKTIPEDQPASLEYFMKDYVGHMLHHIHQILPEFS